MHTKMKVNFVVMHFTHVSGHNGAQSNKLKLKFRKKNSFFFFFNMVLDYFVLPYNCRECGLF